MRGNLAPSGAVIKQSAASQQLLQHRGRAVVLRSLEDLAARVDDPALDIGPDDVMVLQNAGPIGGPGMPRGGLSAYSQAAGQRGAGHGADLGCPHEMAPHLAPLSSTCRQRRRWAARLDWCKVAMRSSSMCQIAVSNCVSLTMS